MDAFREAVQSTTLFLSEKPSNDTWKTVFWAEVLTVCKALKAEQPFLTTPLSMQDWLSLRVVTISARPFFVLFRAGLDLPCDMREQLSSSNGNLARMQLILQSVLGLQNDIIGWEKDHRQSHRLNCIEILIGSDDPPRHAFRAGLDAHNELLMLFLALRQRYLIDIAKRSTNLTAELKYVDLLTNFGHAMADWMISCGRYIPNPAAKEKEKSVVASKMETQVVVASVSC
jgi:hypothetical protein